MFWTNGHVRHIDIDIIEVYHLETLFGVSLEITIGKLQPQEGQKDYFKYASQSTRIHP